MCQLNGGLGGHNKMVESVLKPSFRNFHYSRIFYELYNCPMRCVGWQISVIRQQIISKMSSNGTYNSTDSPRVTSFLNHQLSRHWTVLYPCILGGGFFGRWCCIFDAIESYSPFETILKWLCFPLADSLNELNVTKRCSRILIFIFRIPNYV